jgi:YfiH family protein
MSSNGGDHISRFNPTDLIFPNWPQPAIVRAFFTIRHGGVSVNTAQADLASLNLGRSSGDLPDAIDENRRRLVALLPRAPKWLNQVHGCRVVMAGDIIDLVDAVEADAMVTDQPNIPCAIMVADCLPVLFCDDGGRHVAAAHAGWRGLAAGVLENTVAAMAVAPDNIMAWLGPAIGPSAFEVGKDVYEVFVSRDSAAAACFLPRGEGHPDKFMADIYALARLSLTRAGVTRIYGGNFCTASEPSRFFSYRRAGMVGLRTGRMAGVIWIERQSHQIGRLRGGLNG